MQKATQEQDKLGQDAEECLKRANRLGDIASKLADQMDRDGDDCGHLQVTVDAVSFLQEYVAQVEVVLRLCQEINRCESVGQMFRLEMKIREKAEWFKTKRQEIASAVAKTRALETPYSRPVEELATITVRPGMVGHLERLATGVRAGIISHCKHTGIKEPY